MRVPRPDVGLAVEGAERAAGHRRAGEIDPLPDLHMVGKSELERPGREIHEDRLEAPIAERRQVKRPDRAHTRVARVSAA